MIHPFLFIFKAQKLPFSLQLCIVLVCFFMLTTCSHEPDVKAVENPAAAGFNLENSDPFAIKCADEVMEAMGGRKNWDETRYLSWNFFGSRKHVWDRYSGDIIIHSLRDSLTIAMNINDSTDIELTMKGQNVTEPDSLIKFWRRGKSWWINDSYWLVMPFKLKDSGVTLKYKGQDTTINNEISHLLELSFEEVGRTPNNRYIIYIDTVDHLVKQWDYYTSRADSVPRFQLPWTDYTEHDRILLSPGRGGSRALLEVSANDTLAAFFQSE